MSPLLTLLGALAIEVTGPSTCPTPADVAVELARISAADTQPEGGSGPLVAEIRRPAPVSRLGIEAPAGSAPDPRLWITLRGGDGAILTERTVTESGSCAELAAAAAVVIAAWQGERRPDLAPALPRISPPEPRPVARADTPPSAERPTTAVATATATPPTTPNAAESGNAPGDTPTSALSPPFEVGVAALAATAGDLVPGLRVDASVGSLGWGVAPRLAAALEVPHHLALGPSPGSVVWSRTSLALGLRKRSPVGRLTVDGQLHALGALTRVRGSGFDDNYAGSGFELGAGAGVQFGWPRRWYTPFVGIGASLWPSRTTVAATGIPMEVDLPSFDVSLALGVSFGRFR